MSSPNRTCLLADAQMAGSLSECNCIRAHIGQLLFSAELDQPRILKTGRELNSLLGPLVAGKRRKAIRKPIEEIVDSAVAFARDLARSKTKLEVQVSKSGGKELGPHYNADKMRVTEGSLKARNYANIELMVSPVLIQYGDRSGKNLDKPYVLVKAQVCQGKGPRTEEAGRGERDKANEALEGEETTGTLARLRVPKEVSYAEDDEDDVAAEEALNEATEDTLFQDTEDSLSDTSEEAVETTKKGSKATKKASKAPEKTPKIVLKATKEGADDHDEATVGIRDKFLSKGHHGNHSTTEETPQGVHEEHDEDDSSTSERASEAVLVKSDNNDSTTEAMPQEIRPKDENDNDSDESFVKEDNKTNSDSTTVVTPQEIHLKDDSDQSPVAEGASEEVVVKEDDNSDLTTMATTQVVHIKNESNVDSAAKGTFQEVLARDNQKAGSPTEAGSTEAHLSDDTDNRDAAGEKTLE
ncbi:hypothetical protein GGR56DRAFT_654808 [Xylariaceae sp. FL0804]|nr:hypothetical protein GGR56DRAFT_654808 [Xylariaceae sp. FL0804]